MNSKFYISYRGAKNPQLEEIIQKHCGAFGVTKAGQWGFNEGSFQCLFLYKKQTSLDQYKNKLKQELGMDYSRILFLLG